MINSVNRSQITIFLFLWLITIFSEFGLSLISRSTICFTFSISTRRPSANASTSGSPSWFLLTFSVASSSVSVNSFGDRNVPVLFFRCSAVVRPNNWADVSLCSNCLIILMTRKWDIPLSLKFFGISLCRIVSLGQPIYTNSEQINHFFINICTTSTVYTPSLRCYLFTTILQWIW